MPDPIQLCLAAHRFYPFYAGGALRFKRYLPGLKARQIMSYVFTGTPNLRRLRSVASIKAWEAHASGQILPVETVEGTPVYRLWVPEGSSRQRVWQYSWALARFCTQSENRPHLIQLLPLPYWSLPALVKLSHSGVPLVYAYNLLRKPSDRGVKYLFHRWLRRLQLHLMDCVIVNSSAMRDHLRALGIKTRIEMIANGIDRQRFNPAGSSEARSRVCSQLGIEPEAPLIVHVGSVEPRKGTDLLLAAWGRLASACPRSHLLLVGPRTDLQDPSLGPFRRRLETLVADSGAPDRVHFVGRVDNVEQYLKAADLFVFTSVREGLPNVVLEAMATGLPVITTPFQGLSTELGRAGEHYLLVERDPDRLSRNIKQLLENPQRRRQLSSSALAWVEAEMDLEKVLDRYTDLYRELAHRYQLK